MVSTLEPVRWTIFRSGHRQRRAAAALGSQDPGLGFRVGVCRSFFWVLIERIREGGTGNSNLMETNTQKTRENQCYAPKQLLDMMPS